MGRFKFVHAADLHLDSPFRGLEADEELWPLLRRSTFEALERLGELCLRERADFLVIAGDLFETRDRSVRARLALRDALARLDAAGIPTFIVHGNHDPLTAAPFVALPASVKVFGPQLEEVEVRRQGEALCRIQGISYAQEAVSENLALRFGRRGEGFTLGLLHANLGGQASHENYAPCSARDLDERGLDYWALGHVHTRAEVRLPGGGLAVYPGNLQGRHILESGPRGAVVVEVEGRELRTRFVPLDVVRWERVELDVGPYAQLDALASAAIGAVEALGGDGGPCAHVVRLELVGRGAMHLELNRPSGTSGFEEALREGLSRTGRRLLVESVQDATRPELDLRQVACAGGLAGAVADAGGAPSAALLDELWMDEELRRVDVALDRLGLSTTREQAAPLVERAVLKSVEMLLDEGGA